MARPKYLVHTWDDVFRIGSVPESDGHAKRLHGLELTITHVFREIANSDTGAVGLECRGVDQEGQTGRLIWWEWDGTEMLYQRVRVKEAVWRVVQQRLAVALLDLLELSDDDPIPPGDPSEPTLESLASRIDELENVLGRIRDSIHWRL